jgi:DNA-binding NarL/FixJ family response regulator
MKVFIVDDSRIVRERLVYMLSELNGVEIAGQAENAPEATASIQTAKPDVVILDIRIPGGSGIDVLQQIKQASPAPIVIMLTNYAGLQYRKKCMDARADYFLDKSTEFEKVMEVIGALCGLDIDGDVASEPNAQEGA